MKKTYSPCCIRWKPNIRVHWKEHADQSSKLKSASLYWGNLPTDELEKLVDYSQLSFGDGRRRPLYKKAWLRAAGKSDDDFRAAVIARIRELKAKLLEKVESARKEPHRCESVQDSHELTPSAQAWKLFTNLKVKLEGMMENSAQWDKGNRAAVRENIAKHKKFLAEFESGLPA